MTEEASLRIQRATDEAHPVDPMEYVRVLAVSLDKDPTPDGYDGRPIHWKVSVLEWGILVTDSAGIVDGFQFKVGDPKVTPAPEVVLQMVLEWLANQIPATQYWAVSFRPGTLPVPTSREVI